MAIGKDYMCDRTNSCDKMISAECMVCGINDLKTAYSIRSVSAF